MKDVTVSGQVYQLRKMALLDQFHVSRILAPIVYSGPPFAMLASFAHLSRQDAEYVVNSALAVVQRKQADNWANVGSLGAPMFSDMTIMDFYELAAAVVTESLGGFFPAMLSKIAGQPPLKASNSPGSQEAKIS